MNESLFKYQGEIKSKEGKWKIHINKGTTFKILWKRDNYMVASVLDFSIIDFNMRRCPEGAYCIIGDDYNCDILFGNRNTKKSESYTVLELSMYDDKEEGIIKIDDGMQVKFKIYYNELTIEIITSKYSHTDYMIRHVTLNNYISDEKFLTLY